jgi:hypothetical protein
MGIKTKDYLSKLIKLFRRGYVKNLGTNELIIAVKELNPDGAVEISEIIKKDKRFKKEYPKRIVVHCLIDLGKGSLTVKNCMNWYDEFFELFLVK